MRNERRKRFKRTVYLRCGYSSLLFICDFIFSYSNNTFFRLTKHLLTLAHLVSKIEALLLEEPLDRLCGASAVCLLIENSILPSFDYVRGVIDRAVNLSLLKIEAIERKI